MEKIKIVPVPSGPYFAQVGTLRYLCCKDEYGDDFLAFVGAKQIKTPCSHFPAQAWHVHVTCTVHIVDAIQSRPFGRSAISCLHGNNIQHFKFIKMTVYPLVELTGAVLIIPSAAQILQLLAHATSLILPFTHNRIKELNKNVK